ncbi:MAG: TlpA disulfide reductase family protein [Niabella sp.]
MKKITLLGVMVGVCPKIYCQSNAVDLKAISEPLYVDNWIKPSNNLGKVINYTDSTLHLSDFSEKLVIIGFWFTSCSPCVANFPKEDSLQKAYKKDVQFILATFEPEPKIRSFLRKWEEKHNTHFSIPIIVEDTLLRKTFHVKYNPHYLWITPGGKLVAQTSEHFVNAECIEAIMPAMNKYRKRMANNKPKQ